MKPRSLPRHLLDDPAVRHALAQRDLAPLFRAARKVGISYYAIGEACALSADRVSLVARGSSSISSIDVIERIADGLRIPGALLGLAARRWELTPGEEGPVDRRELLRGAIVAGAALPLLNAVDVRAETDQALAYAGVEDITAMEAAVERHSRGYQGRAPADALSELVADVAVAAPLLRAHHPRSLRADLARTVGQLGGMAAIVLHDLGHGHEASAWFATAINAAQQAGDRRLHGWLLARKAMIAVNYGAPHVAARTAEQARQTAGASTSAAAALAASVAARAYALSGRHEDATNALHHADRIADRLSVSESADTWLGHGEQKHHVHRSQALTCLGRTQEARESQRAALALSSTGGMTRSLLLLDDATCMTHEGDPAGACDAAANALDRTPYRYRTGLVRQRAAALYRSIPEHTRGTAEARRLVDMLVNPA